MSKDSPLTYDARQVASWFLQRGNEDGQKYSIMSLLKLTYIAHGWFLALRDRALFANEIEAWQKGPVIEDVYNEYRKQGVFPKAVSKKFSPSGISEDDIELLEDVYEKYKKLGPFQLSDLTHQKDSPWDISWKMGGLYTRIPDAIIKNHFLVLKAKSQKEASSD